jgi:hypothetical protein
MSKHSKTVSDATRVVQLMPNGGGSDITLKKNVLAISDALKQVLALRPVTWNWKTSGDDRLQYGFIAQEVEDIFPDLVEVKKWKDGTQRKFLSTNELMAYLVVAIKEQQVQIDKLQASVNGLASESGSSKSID